MKHRRLDAGSGIRSNARACPKITQLFDNCQPDSQRELFIRAPTASTSAFQQVLPAASTTPQNKHFSDRTRRSPYFFGFENSSPDSEITATPKRLRRAGDVENYQPTNISVVETVQTLAEKLPAEDNISPTIGIVSPPP